MAASAETAIVTGGASGIGRAVAAKLGALGHSVAVWDVAASAGSAFVAELVDRGVRAEFFEVDVSDRERVAGAIEEANTRIGPPAILVACAGISHATPVSELSTEEWYRVMRVNLDGVFFCVAEVAKSMIQNRTPGRIVTVSSTAAFNGFSRRAAYCSSKSGVVGLTRAAALDLAQFGIRINSVAPGSTITGLIKDASDPALQELIGVSPMKRWAQPEEIAEAVSFLVQPTSSFVTGVILPVDGGWTAGRLSLAAGVL